MSWIVSSTRRRVPFHVINDISQSREGSESMEYTVLAWKEPVSVTSAGAVFWRKWYVMECDYVKNVRDTCVL